MQATAQGSAGDLCRVQDAAPYAPVAAPRPLAAPARGSSLSSRAAALEHLFRLRIQTRAGSTPQEALTEAINALILEVNKMEDQFRDQKAEFQQRNPQPMNEGI